MKHSDKSVLITQVIVKICYVLLLGLVILLPVCVYGNVKPIGLEINIIQSLGKRLIIPFYLVVPAGYTALICLDKLLGNVKKSRIFYKQNVILLRILSYCCFYAALGSLISFIVVAKIYMPFETFLVMSVGEGFVGLVVRVVKNVFEKAIEIKEENDLVV